MRLIVCTNLSRADLKGSGAVKSSSCHLQLAHSEVDGRSVTEGACLIILHCVRFMIAYSLENAFRAVAMTDLRVSLFQSAY